MSAFTMSPSGPVPLILESLTYISRETEEKLCQNCSYTNTRLFHFLELTLLSSAIFLARRLAKIWSPAGAELMETFDSNAGALGGSQDTLLSVGAGSGLVAGFASDAEGQ